MNAQAPLAKIINYLDVTKVPWYYLVYDVLLPTAPTSSTDLGVAKIWPVMILEAQDRPQAANGSTAILTGDNLSNL